MPDVDELLARPESRRPISGAHDAQVARDLGDGTVMLHLPFYDDSRYEYGPAPWPAGTVTPWSETDTHTHELPVSAVGLWCVVVFADDDVHNPRVLAAYPGWEPDR